MRKTPAPACNSRPQLSVVLWILHRNDSAAQMLGPKRDGDGHQSTSPEKIPRVDAGPDTALEEEDGSSYLSPSALSKLEWAKD